MQRNGLSVDQASALIASLSTALLAMLTAWLAWDTHHLAQLTARQVGFEARIGLVRECAVDTRNDVQSRDALIDLKPNTKDGYEGSDQVSRSDIFTYLQAPNDDYLRCTLTNFGKLPLLDVQTIFDADFPHSRKVKLVSTRFHVIAPNESKTTWFANNSRDTIIIHSPQRVRYRTFEHPNQIMIEQIAPTLKDRWFLRPRRDVEEFLDQSETEPFEKESANTEGGTMQPESAAAFDLTGWSTFALALITAVLAAASFGQIFLSRLAIQRCH